MPKKQQSLRSPPSQVRLRAHFPNPLKDAIAAARTCYSPRIIHPNEVTEEETRRIGATTYEGGHHTVYQHQMFEFEINYVSRAFVHDFLHAQPFFNSSQQSQRYVKLDPPSAAVPPIPNRMNQRRFVKLILNSWEKYREITKILVEDITQKQTSSSLLGTAAKKMRREILEKAMEAARYELCIGSHTLLIHTIDGVTLWRFHRLRNLTWETSDVIRKMVDEVKRVDPGFMENVEAEVSLTLNNPTEFQHSQQAPDSKNHEKFIKEFDDSLRDRRTKLIAWNEKGEELLAEAVRTVLGLPAAAISNEDALQLVLNPSKNTHLADNVNLSTVSPITRTLNHVQYTFRKKLSHTADSQDQRHRTIPSSKPLTIFADTRKPDYITPLIIERNKTAMRIHEEWMEELWEKKNELLDDGVPSEYLAYVLPQATTIRLEETGSILNLWYKYMNRSCLRAEEEIWRVTMEEIAQVKKVHPRIGSFFGPPCFIRQTAAGRSLPEDIGKIKYCNQGRLYCRQPVWNFYPKVSEENILRVI
ncbi:MAG: hypothetical protein CMO12_03610 [Thaumarchaeota archaeon]|nr:hypothetical protein [Nitrososphaerota archaeon]